MGSALLFCARETDILGFGRVRRKGGRGIHERISDRNLYSNKNIVIFKKERKKEARENRKI
jgi:hypothetical protein